MSNINELQKHIGFMQRYKSIDTTIFDSRIKIAKAQKNLSKLKEIHEELFTKILKEAKVNFVIENLPKYGQDVNSKMKSEVNAKSIHNTINDFAKAKNAVVFRDNAYIWFESNNDAKYVHSLLNGMQLGNNIIKTKYIV
jgi:TPP-dependent 2-oxoacid decarboxylase